MLDSLERLVNKSLVIAEERGGGIRFRLLETLRQYAAERMAAAGEGEDVGKRHAQFCLALAREAEPRLNGAEQGAWLDRLDEEHDNLRAALQWLGAHASPDGVELAGAIWQFWYLRGYLREGRLWIERSLATCPAAGAAARSRALAGAGTLAWRHGDYAAAWMFCEESRLLCERTGDIAGLAFVANQLAVIARDRGELEHASELQQRALALYQGLGNTWGTALALNNLDLLAQLRSDYDSAARWYDEGLRLYVDLGDKWGTALSLNNLGVVAQARRDFPQALSRHRQGLVLQQSLGHRQGIAEGLTRVGGVAAAMGQVERAARLLAAGETLRRAIGVAVPPSDRGEYEEYHAIVELALPRDALLVLSAEGEQMTAERAVAYALSAADDRLAPDAAPVEGAQADASSSGGRAGPAGMAHQGAGAAGLTDREADVLCLLAGGLSNRQIAERLVLSVHTVERHIATIYRKIGSHGRAGAATYALQHGLSPFDDRRGSE